jgi:hypothetical protein
MANTMDFDEFANGSNHSLSATDNHAYNAIEVNDHSPEAPNLASEVIIHNPPLEDKWGRFDVFALLVDKKIGRVLMLNFLLFSSDSIIGTGLFSTPALVLSVGKAAYFDQITF